MGLTARTGKPGPKPKSPNGHPKVRYHTRMATDLIAFLRTLPNAAELIERAVRKSDEFRAYMAKGGEA